MCEFFSKLLSFLIRDCNKFFIQGNSNYQFSKHIFTHTLAERIDLHCYPRFFFKQSKFMRMQHVTDRMNFVVDFQCFYQSQTPIYR